MKFEKFVELNHPRYYTSTGPEAMRENLEALWVFTPSTSRQFFSLAASYLFTSLLYLYLMEIEVKFTSASTKLSQFHWVQFHFYFNAHHKCAFLWGKWNRDYCWLGKWNRDYEVSSEVEFFLLRHEIFCPRKVLNKAKLRLQGVKVFKLCGFIVKIKKKTFHSM